MLQRLRALWAQAEHDTPEELLLERLNVAWEVDEAEGEAPLLGGLFVSLRVLSWEAFDAALAWLRERLEDCDIYWLGGRECVVYLPHELREAGALAGEKGN